MFSFVSSRQETCSPVSSMTTSFSTNSRTTTHTSTSSSWTVSPNQTHHREILPSQSCHPSLSSKQSIKWPLLTLTWPPGWPWEKHTSCCLKPPATVNSALLHHTETCPPPASDQGSSQLSEGRVEIFSLEIQNINFITLSMLIPLSFCTFLSCESFTAELTDEQKVIINTSETSTC